MPIIYAIVHPDNHNSIRVAERLGMRAMGRTDRYHGQELRLFAIEEKRTLQKVIFRVQVKFDFRTSKNIACSSGVDRSEL